MTVTLDIDEGDGVGSRLLRGEDLEGTDTTTNIFSNTKEISFFCKACTLLSLILMLMATFMAGVVLSSQGVISLGTGCKFGHKGKLPDSVYSPAHVIQEYQAVRFDGKVETTNMYKGVPGPGLDNAWSQLFDVGPLLVTTEELKKIRKTSVEVPSRPGHHLAKLAVFHQLHCLDKIRRYVHNDHYNMTDEGQSVSIIDHVDHCIDIIRQVIMCRADTTLITFNHGSGPFSPVEPDFDATHTCQNFAEVHTWAKKKEINMTEEAIKNPEAFRDALVESIDRKLGEKGQ
ncbi:hypothetical protein LOZ12_005688 [Ophidiomyces ophidiicola]|uniref:Uncharacterized protein n=1 Tax=Ophidiomyces ophidiicola TaxID=1387563 RepID=A0ACB8V1B4_9EURO|nr:uncharacterized protein LOZ57_002135 [Ophidiomyces ophidiicola]KAI1909231.1 hypothetical protein LOZ61_005098 [Ophidiomyces ophidiicola]KAI1912081.1 hypothetical protein LOZ64_004560 [Ophidiomyces ophidiicola]KAI1927755.1 hypothetical protein LOZ60_002869 [Ophidiomyces ophidiicola]KAI1937872.1 hypothetical protein LOZ62_005365 [Ophidiomyces ophidiicola]KAI1950572.1 hypothetical protein LOZ57_002135 [Ophidiomyces ophidiicola]